MEPDLSFPPHDPRLNEQVSYHEYSATERAIIDDEFASGVIITGLTQPTIWKEEINAIAF